MNLLKGVTLNAESAESAPIQQNRRADRRNYWMISGPLNTSLTGAHAQLYKAHLSVRVLVQLRVQSGHQCI